MYKDTSGKTYLTHSAIRKERTDIAFPRFITDQFLALYGIKPVIPEPDYTLDELKAKKIAQIKSSAQELIAGLEWRIERAIEREKLDEPGESLAEVYREREAIRKANNRLEAAITSATDESELDIELQITSEDWPPAKRLITEH